MSTLKRAITFQFTAPAPLGSYAGFYLQLTPNYSASVIARLDGTTLLDGTPVVQGATAPLNFGPFDYADFPGGCTVMIPEPVQHPIDYQYVVESYNGSGTVNPVSTSVSGTFTLQLPIAKPLAGVARTRNPSGITPQAAVNKSGGGLGAAGTGTLYTFIPVTWTNPVNDPTYQGVVFEVVDVIGTEYSTWGPILIPATSTTLTFPTPTAVGVYTVYLCGWDGTDANPIVPGITPSFTVTVGVNGGVVDPTQVPVGSGVSNTGPLAIRYGAALKDDGSGNATINLDPAAPFSIVSSQLGFKTSDGLQVVGGVLSAKVDGATITFSGGVIEIGGVPISKLGGGTGTLPAGWTYAGNIAINQLVVGGNAYFGATAVFAYDATHPGLEIGSAGMILVDNVTTPVNTVAVSATGVSVGHYDSTLATYAAGTTYAAGATVKVVADGANYVSLKPTNTGNTPSSSPTWWALINVVSVTSAGIGVYGPTCSLTITSFGVLMTSGATGAALSLSTAGGLLIQDPTGAHYVQVNSSGVTIVGGTFSDTSGTVTVTIDATNFVKIVDSSNSFVGQFSNTGLSISGIYSAAGYTGSYGARTAYVTHNPSGNVIAISASNGGAQLLINANQVVTHRQTGPGIPSGFADNTAQLWCNALYTALSSGGGHGLIN